MIKFDNTMFGRKVRFINAKAHEEMPEFYPEVGTIGTIIPCTWSYFEVEFLIDWPERSTGMDCPLACGEESLEFVEEITDYTNVRH